MTAHPKSIDLARKDTLRFVACGSVEGGTSFVDRLLGDARPPIGDRPPEREHGIATDVPCRDFRTARRRFVVSGAPASGTPASGTQGDEHDIGAIARAAMGADLALIGVDARHGVLASTLRHATVVSLLGVRHIVLAVDNMDAMGWSPVRFRTIRRDFAGHAAELGLPAPVCIPISTLHGDNVSHASTRTPWYDGPTLLAYLETAEPDAPPADTLRLPVQSADRPDSRPGGFSGTVCGGRLAVGTPVRVVPGDRQAAVARIVGPDGDRAEAITGEAVTVVLDPAVEVSPGDVVVAAGDGTIAVADQLQARLIWMDERPLVPGRPYILRLGAAHANASVMAIKHRINLDTRAQEAARTLRLNEVGTVTLSLDRPLPFDRHVDNRALGGFVLVDTASDATVAAGVVDYPLRRATNVVWHAPEVTSALRARQKGQQACCFWFTGLSGSGKSTLASMLDKRLTAENRHTYILDGDNVRHGLNRDLGFTEADRVENIRRIAEVAKLMVDAGLIVLVCAISPYRRDRELARSLFADGQFVEVFVDTPLEECEKRDPKGLYAKARAGQIPNFTGISAPYEAPDRPDAKVDGRRPVEELVGELLAARGL